MNRLSGFVERGDALVIQNLSGSQLPVQGSYPLATVTVYLPSTLTLATIYSDSSGTPKSNPFTAATDGSYSFYTAESIVDLNFSGGGLPTAFTLPSVFVSSADFNLFTFNVRAFGAYGTADGSHDSTSAFLAAWNAAIATNGRCAIYIPADPFNYIITQVMPAFVGKAVIVYGDSHFASQIQANYTGGPVMQWQPSPGQQTLNGVLAHDFGIVSSHAVTGIRSIATSYSRFRNIYIQINHVNGVAHEIQGWDQTKVIECSYQAGHPLKFNKVTAGTGTGSGQCDAFSFQDCEIWSFGDASPLLEWENGASFTRSYIGGDTTLVGGSDFIKFISIGAFNEVGIYNAHWENGVVQNATPALHGFFADIEPGTGSAELIFQKCSGGSAGAQGWKIRNTQRITWIGCNFTGSWAAPFAQLDVDNTCDKLGMLNFALANATNATRTIGSQLVREDSNFESTTPGWYFKAYYEKPDANPDLLNANIAGAPVSKVLILSLAVGASQALASPGHLDATAGTAFCLTRFSVLAEHAIKADGTWEYADFKTVYFGVSMFNASANIAASDTVGKLSVIYLGGTFPITIKNNLAVPVRVRVVID